MLATDPALKRTLRGHRGTITSVAWAPSDRQLASGGADNTVMVWNFSPGKPAVRAFRFVGHTVRTDERSTPPTLMGATALATAAAAGKLRTFSYCCSPLCAHPPTHASCLVQAPVQCVAFSPDGTQLASGSKDNSVRLWTPSV